MTINIGINLGDYIILAADTRTVYVWPNKIIHHSDEHQKIQKTKIGLITGAGYKDLLDDAKRQISQKDIENTDQIIDIIRKCREDFSPELFSFSPPGRRWIEATSWLLTYMTPVDNSPTLRLALIHPQFNDEIALYKKNTCCVIMPAESTLEECDRITNLVHSQIKLLEDISTIHKNIRHHVILIREVIKVVSEKYQSVSEFFQVGIHTIDGKIGISAIIKNGPFSINLS